MGQCKPRVTQENALIGCGVDEVKKKFFFSSPGSWLVLKSPRFWIGWQARMWTSLSSHGSLRLMVSSHPRKHPLKLKRVVFIFRGGS